MATAKEIMDANLNGHGHTVYEAAKNAGFEIALNEEGRLDLADACALVDHESAGGQNIFGCDWGARWTWEPPYCNVEVTAERVQALLRNIEEGGGQNGVGLTQLTSVGFVRQAEQRGGAHLPEHQCSVGFEYLKSLVDDLGYMYGIAAYNAGPGNAQLGIDNGYYDKIMAKREKWKELLAGSVIGIDPAREGSELVADQITLGYDQEGWAYDTASGLYVKSTTADLDHKTNKDGWLWAKVEPGEIPPPTWSWPEAWDEPIPDSWIYQARHPTRYVWRPDVEVWARWLVDNFNVWCNTYYEHPEERGFEEASTDPDGTVWYIENTSLDVWGLPDRNNPLGLTVGWQIFRILMDDPSPPNIRWIIWQATQYGAWNSWDGEPFGGNDPFMQHYDHIHVTYW